MFFLVSVLFWTLVTSADSEFSLETPGIDSSYIIFTGICTQGDVRLSDWTSGRVEVCKNNIWGTVCADSANSWGDHEAMVVCRQLGYSSEGQ